MINYSMFQNIATAVGMYTQERWTLERTINSTGIVTSGAELTVDAEGFTGQLRWFKPTVATVNTASLSVATDGSYTDIATDVATYIKTVRSVGVNQVNLSKLITNVDGIAVVGNDLAKNRAQDEHKAIVSMLQGVAASEIALGGGITSFDTVPDGSTGMYVDVNALGAFGAAATSSANARRLVDPSEAGAARGERLFRAMGMAWKDYEPEYVYLITTPESMADFRAANLVDQTRITDGNIEFQTLFDGKFRLLLTRTNQGNFAASANVNDQSTKVSFMVLPGAIAFREIPIEIPVEIDRAPAAYMGGGTTALWSRYGFIAHPRGYTWAGSSSAFASNAAFASGASWTRKYDPLNLSILPILHA